MTPQSDAPVEKQDTDRLAGAGLDALPLDVPKGMEAESLSQQILDGEKQRLAHRRWLFLISMAIICISLISVIALIYFRAVGEQRISDNVFIAFMSAVMVQSFLLIRILALSLFPRDNEKTTQKVEKDEA